MKVLLHICCAPCLIYPLEILQKEGFSVSGFFYNPNIHPFSEYKTRRDSLYPYAEKINLEVICPEYDVNEYFRKIAHNESAPGRCKICFRLRLEKTAQFARDNKFNSFTTTLLVSPYQDQELLKTIGEKLSQDLGIDFFYRDFRPGNRPAHAKAKAAGLYCQKYCGCLYSEIERSRTKC